jgi:hypothetical protein
MSVLRESIRPRLGFLLLQGLAQGESGNGEGGKFWRAL